MSAAVIQVDFNRPRTRLHFGDCYTIPFKPRDLKKPILVVSRADSGRLHWVGFMEDADQETLDSLFTCIDRLESGSCEYEDEDGFCDCDPLYTGSLYLGSQEDLDATDHAYKHPCFVLTGRCKELCLGDYV